MNYSVKTDLLNYCFNSVYWFKKLYFRESFSKINALWIYHIYSFIQSIMIIISWLLYNIKLETLYVSYIRPLLEYGDVVWDNCNSALSDSLKLIHKRVGRIITGAILQTITEALYRELDRTSLKERRKSNSICLLHKTWSSLPPRMFVKYSWKSILMSITKLRWNLKFRL